MTMELLIRVRSLAAKALLILGLGMCLISSPNLNKYVPTSLLHQLERFYKAQELREKERLRERALEKTITAEPQKTL